jgi:hypothetical protein
VTKKAEHTTISDKGENLCYFRKKEQCIALGKQLRKYKIENYKVYRINKARAGRPSLRVQVRSWDPTPARLPRRSRPAASSCVLRFPEGGRPRREP